MVKGLIVGAVCAAAILVADERGVVNASAASSSSIESGRVVGMGTVGAVPTRTAAAPAQKPAIRGAVDARRAWLGAEHKGLSIQKVSNRSDRSIQIELRYKQDVVAIGVDAAGTVTVARAGRRVRATAPEALERIQQVLAGSDAVFAARLLHAEREAVSDLKAAEMSLLSATAFVASLTGDTDAPRRLSDRFVQKHSGIFRPVRSATCYDTYTTEATAAWNDMQNCMSEANQDESLLNRAYRRVACNAIWLLRSESAWIEYLACLGPGHIFE